ncbi:5'-methylthioadenosine/adenosylhomocysteine nucleosidase [uncultured Bacteroides sp.]|uniref:5'-methylthioadenosine/adenosylhomocysteine nucleosidase n=1 Tax=uncultured Bacteroides sp. TaxID=162156 RepID=UPI00260A5CD3|nr:5'-methylthioadenosine/adenosylhomocysteine nucleosidase [uncultured Bacteroides sp.]
MTIGIISAMDSEHRQLVERLQEKKVVDDGGFHYVEGMLGGNRLILTQCGIGKVSAAVGATELLRRFAPDCVISTGVAGGIDTCLKVTDVVVSERLVYHDVWCGEGNEYGQVQGFPATYEGCSPLLKQALSLNGDGLESRIHSGLICTGDQFITSRAELDAIKQRFPAGLAVDMESAAIAQTCYVYHTPFLSFRIISDTPGVEDHSSQYADFWGTMAERSFHTIWAFLSVLPESIHS